MKIIRSSRLGIYLDKSIPTPFIVIIDPSFPIRFYRQNDIYLLDGKMLPTDHDMKGGGVYIVNKMIGVTCKMSDGSLLI
jgi:hypothetical protein